jgi:hypothetical protein
LVIDNLKTLFSSAIFILELSSSSSQTSLTIADIHLSADDAHNIHTVKTSYFGPHGNFGFFLASSGVSLDELRAKEPNLQI